MTLDAFYLALLRIGNLETADVVAAGVTMSLRNRTSFDRDPVAFFMTEAGPSRRRQIFDLANGSGRRTVPIVAVIEDRAPLPLAAE